MKEILKLIFKKKNLLFEKNVKKKTFYYDKK